MFVEYDLLNAPANTVDDLANSSTVTIGRQPGKHLAGGFVWRGGVKGAKARASS